MDFSRVYCYNQYNAVLELCQYVTEMLRIVTNEFRTKWYNCPVRLNKVLIRIITVVGGAGRRKNTGGNAGLRVAKELIKPSCGSTSGKNGADVRAVEDFGQIVCNRVSDAAVIGAFYVAGTQYIPQRNAGRKGQKAFALCSGRKRLLEHFAEHPPKSVLRIAVVKPGLPGLGGGHGAQNQHP